MDIPIFVISEWTTLLVDIRCPRDGSYLGIPIHFFSSSCTGEC